MRKLNYKIYTLAFAALTGSVVACKKDFLEKTPAGTLNEQVLSTKAGVDGILIGAYSLLDGIGGPGGDLWSRAISNWIWGGVASDDAHKGSEYGDQPQIEQVESYTTSSNMPHLYDKWATSYAGVQRANDVIRLVRKATGIAPADTMQIVAEARFLRAIQHFEVTKVFGSKVPYVNEGVTYDNGNYFVKNDASIYPQIIADLQFAATNLTPSKSQIGRANSWAAKALLAKVYMHDRKFSEANTILKDVIANGTNAAGTKYKLNPLFYKNFRASSDQYNSETVFSVIMSVGDAANGRNGNAGDALNFPGGGPATCCGFYQPSFGLANAYKVDAVTGLPLFENDAYNATNLKNDMGLKSTDPYVLGTEALDPRIDWTIGRRGIPYLDWGLQPGQTWVRAQSAAGPYLPVKNIYWKADQSSQADFFDGWAPNQATGNDYNYLRFADVLLMAAECEVEVGSVAVAEGYVNQVRKRMEDPSTWVHTYVDNSDPSKGFTSTPAANYKLGLYTGQFLLKGAAYAREAVRFERRLELAMEGQRFFDLQRYDGGTGYMANTLNAYIAKELLHMPGYKILAGASFKKGQDEVFPIPQGQIDISGGTLKQNQNTGL